MSASLLKAVMEKNGKTNINVASDTGLSPNTVAKYLRGEPVTRANERLLQLWAEQHSKDSGETDVA